MVVSQWQQKRCRAIETALFSLHMRTITRDEAVEEIENLGLPATEALAFMKLADESRALSLLMRYRNMHLRHYDRAMKQLITLRTKGIFNHSEKPNEPRTRLNAHIKKEQTSAPQAPQSAPEALRSEYMPGTGASAFDFDGRPHELRKTA